MVSHPGQGLTAYFIGCDALVLTATPFIIFIPGRSISPGGGEGSWLSGATPTGVSSSTLKSLATSTSLTSKYSFAIATCVLASSNSSLLASSSVPGPAPNEKLPIDGVSAVPALAAPTLLVRGGVTTPPGRPNGAKIDGVFVLVGPASGVLPAVVDAVDGIGSGVDGLNSAPQPVAARARSGRWATGAARARAEPMDGADDVTCTRSLEEAVR